MIKVSADIESLVPYSPGKPIEETQKEFGLDHVIKLASNENPLGPSPKVLEALHKAIHDLHRYPDGSFVKARRALASHYNVDEQNISLGNGSNEVIDLLIRTFTHPGDKMLTSASAFIAYKICAKAYGLKVIETPLTADMCFDLEELADQALKLKPKIIFIANPNNPTGTYVSQSELELFFQKISSLTESLIVIDEAYLEFVRADDFPQTLPFLAQYDNLVLSRTLSKAYGLAGLRVGALIAHPRIIDYFDRVRNPFNVNYLAQEAACVALQDKAYVQKSRKINNEGLDYFYKELAQLGLTYWPSQANFILFDTKKEAFAVYQSLLEKGVIVRPIKAYGLATHLRLSVGLPEENKRAMAALGEVLK